MCFDGSDFSPSEFRTHDAESRLVYKCGFVTHVPKSKTVSVYLKVDFGHVSFCRKKQKLVAKGLISPKQKK